MSARSRELSAHERAQAKYGFYKHLAVYFAVNLMLVLINLVTDRSTFWSVWPMLGWGVAIVIHAARVFVFDTREAEIVDRLAERERRRDAEGRG